MIPPIESIIINIIFSNLEVFLFIVKSTEASQ